MNEPVKKRAVVVGLFVILGLLFLVGGILTIGNLHSTFSNNMTVSTVFKDVNGLQAGNNIWFSGVKVGTVKKIEIFGDAQVRVILNIDETAKEFIRKDAKVKISSDGFIGNKILVIYGGTDKAAAIEEGDVLGNETLLSTDDIMNTLQQNNLNILKITTALAEGQGSMGKLLKDDSLYRETLAILYSLQKTNNKAHEFMTYLANYGSKLDDKGTLANDLVTDTTVMKSLRETMAQVNQIADTTAAMMSSLNQAVNNPKTPMGVMLRDEQAGQSMRSTIMRLDSTSMKLDREMEALQYNWIFRSAHKKQEKEKAKAAKKQK